MKEAMLILIGTGAGFAICGCLMFYIMAQVTKSNARGKNHMEVTEQLMRERNSCDWAIEAHLSEIVKRMGK